jgi:hypothetical protein
MFQVINHKSETCSRFFRQKQRTLLTSFGQRPSLSRAKRVQHFGLSRHNAYTISYRHMLLFPGFALPKTLHGCLRTEQVRRFHWLPDSSRTRSFSSALPSIESDRVVALHRGPTTPSRVSTNRCSNLLQSNDFHLSNFQFLKTLQSGLQTDRVCEICIARVLLSIIFLSNLNWPRGHRHSLNLTPIDDSN